MTQETRIVFEVSDIKAVRFRHQQCGGEIVQKLGDKWAIPQACPLCGQPYSDDMDEELAYMQRQKLKVRLLNLLRKPSGIAILRLVENALGENRKPPLDIRFELDKSAFKNAD